MLLKETPLGGCYEVQPQILKDERGAFIKTFHRDIFKQYNLETQFAEEYYSVSHGGVLRGLHFQRPDQEHTKLVYCIAGEVFDVVVDLRVASPSYGKYAIFNLSSEKANIIYIPKGFAHGFLVLSKSAILVYKVSTVYSPQHDSGIHWDSVEIPWPIKDPLVSKRDSNLPLFADFRSPFTY